MTRRAAGGDAAVTLVLTGSDVQALGAAGVSTLLASARSAGVDEVVVEVDEVPAEVAAACRSHGLRLLIGITCFHEHGAISLDAHPELWPVSADGTRRPRLEWYVGLVPTVAWAREEIADRAERLAGHPDVAGVVLDFIRWPLHWELECREGGPRLAPASFDAATRHAFASEVGESLRVDVTQPTNVAADQEDAWQAFRCAVISGLVDDICRRVHAQGRTVGAFVVPVPGAERRGRTGQDVATWRVDTLYPMTYHAILHRPPAWVRSVVREVRCESPAQVVPVLQVTADPAMAHGADWGPEFDAEEFGALLASVWEGSSRVALFPGSALVGERLAAARSAFDRYRTGSVTAGPST